MRAGAAFLVAAPAAAFAWVEMPFWLGFVASYDTLAPPVGTWWLDVLALVASVVAFAAAGLATRVTGPVRWGVLPAVGATLPSAVLAQAYAIDGTVGDGVLALLGSPQVLRTHLGRGIHRVESGAFASVLVQSTEGAALPSALGILGGLLAAGVLAYGARNGTDR